MFFKKYKFLDNTVIQKLKKKNKSKENVTLILISHSINTVMFLLDNH